MNTGRVLQVNLSKGGVPKRPVTQAFLGTLGFEGDSFRHPKFHGGPKQAVLLITIEGLAEVAASGFPVYPGALGENLTISGVSRYELQIGSCLEIGDALIRITKMRVPCAALNRYGSGIQRTIFDSQVKANNPSSTKWGLAGFYAEVLRTGYVQQEDPVALQAPGSISHATSA